MKKTFLLPLVLMLMLSVTAQKIKKPSIGFEFMVKSPIDSTVFFSFQLQVGDKLVYHVNANGNEYDFIVTLNNESYEEGIDFNYVMTNADSTKGHVLITPNGRYKSKKYVNYFKGGELKLTNACTVWMSSDNVWEYPVKHITLDSNKEENFYYKKDNTYDPVINFKGKLIKPDYAVYNNATDGSGNKTLWVNQAPNNNLFLKMDLGWTIELKEVR